MLMALGKEARVLQIPTLSARYNQLFHVQSFSDYGMPLVDFQKQNDCFFSFFPVLDCLFFFF
jgi:hypothetical protein